MKKLAPEIKLPAFSIDKTRSFVEIAADGKTGNVSPAFPKVMAANSREPRAAGLQVMPWIANKPEQWQRLIDVRIDAINTDDPEGLVIYLHRKTVR